MPPKQSQSVPTPKKTRLSYKDKAAIIEAAKKGGGKDAVRDKMMSEYQIGRTAYYALHIAKLVTGRAKRIFVFVPAGFSDHYGRYLLYKSQISRSLYPRSLFMY